jgi:hypothetical protein
MRTRTERRRCRSIPTHCAPSYGEVIEGLPEFGLLSKLSILRTRQEGRPRSFHRIGEVAGFDDDTVLAFQATITRTWRTSTAERTTRDADQPGVRLRTYTNLRLVLEEASSPEPTPSAT